MSRQLPFEGSLTTQALYSFIAAEEIATREGDALISDRHVLLGLSRCSGSAGFFLQRFGLGADELLILLPIVAKPLDPSEPRGITDDVKILMERAVLEVHGLGHGWITSGHLLLGIFSQRNKPYEIVKRAIGLPHYKLVDLLRLEIRTQRQLNDDVELHTPKANDPQRQVNGLWNRIWQKFYTLHYAVNKRLFHYKEVDLGAKLGKPVEAILGTNLQLEFLNRLLERYPDHTHLYLYRAGLHSDLKNYEVALSDFAAAQALQPEMAAVYWSRAHVYTASNNYEAAIQDCLSALRYFPAHRITRYLLSYIYQQLDQPQKALAVYDQIVAETPEINAFMGRAELRNHLNDMRGALSDYNTVLAINPTYSSALLGSAGLLIDLKDFSVAEKHLEQYKELDSENDTHTIMMTWLRYSEGQYSEALALLLQIADSVSDDFGALHTMGATYEKLGNTDKAVEFYKKALENWPKKYPSRFEAEREAMIALVNIHEKP